jgi:hypothetical protein
MPAAITGCDQLLVTPGADHSGVPVAESTACKSPRSVDTMAVVPETAGAELDPEMLVDQMSFPVAAETA